jgi:hypothetical protein
MICPYCGKEHPDEAVFCPSTGKSISRTLTCPHCGDVHPSDMQFCPKTGKALSLQPTSRPSKRRLWSCILIPIVLLLFLSAAGIVAWRNQLIPNPLQMFVPTSTPTSTNTATATPSLTPSPTRTPTFTPSITPSPTIDTKPIFTLAARTLQAQFTQTAFALAQSEILLEDDFSSSQWGVGTDADSSIEYVNEALQMVVFTKNYFVWSTPNDQDYENIHMEVTAINNETDPTTAFGIICNQQVSTASFYYFAITPAGQYAIAKAAAGEDDIFLTNDNEWKSSDLISKNASSYRISVDCGSGRLTLFVDGQMIASASDSSYTSGGVALFTWSGEDATSTNVAFDDFLMEELK